MSIELIIYALSLAAVYSLMAIGISLLWSSLGMINMAYGATFACGGYTALMTAKLLVPSIKVLLAGTGFVKLGIAVVTLGGGMLGGALAGLITYYVAFLPIHDKPNFSVRSLILTLAINLASVQLLLMFFGPRNKALPKIFGFGKFEVFGASLRYDQLGIIVITSVLLMVVLTWLAKSRKGLEIRAMMQNPEGAALCGISLRRTALPIMLLTGALAGMAAVLLSQTIFVNPYAGATPLMKGLTIALLGGLGSVRGAMIGALAIGFLEAVVGLTPWLGQRYVLLSQFIFIIGFLIIRPRGISGLLDETRK